MLPGFISVMLVSFRKKLYSRLWKLVQKVRSWPLTWGSFEKGSKPMCVLGIICAFPTEDPQRDNRDTLFGDAFIFLTKFRFYVNKLSFVMFKCVCYFIRIKRCRIRSSFCKIEGFGPKHLTFITNPDLVPARAVQDDKSFLKQSSFSRTLHLLFLT